MGQDDPYWPFPVTTDRSEGNDGTAIRPGRPRTQPHGLGLFVRSLVGLDREAAKRALARFLTGGTLGANQIEFVNLIVDHLTEFGAMDPALLVPDRTVAVAAGGSVGVDFDLPRFGVSLITIQPAAGASDAGGSPEVRAAGLKPDEPARTEVTATRSDTLAADAPGGEGVALDFADLKRRPITVYIVLPAERMRTHSVWLRLVIVSALRALYKPGGLRTLFMLDEFAQLGQRGCRGAKPGDE